MKRLIVLVLGLVFSFALSAQASILINFDDIEPTEDEVTYSTSAGNVYLGWNVGDNIDSLYHPDHTSDNDVNHFLSESWGDGGYMDFDFGVESFDFWWLALPGVSMYGEAYGWDEFDEEFYSTSEELIGDGTWQFINADGFPGLVYGLQFWTEGDNEYEICEYDPDQDEIVCNTYMGAAIDDVRLFLPDESNDAEENGPITTPEPASMILMGIGLAGAMLKKRQLKVKS